VRRFLPALIVALQFCSAAQAQGPAVRPEIGRPIQQASDLVKAKRGKEALAKLREAQAVTNRTAYEQYLIDRVLGLAHAAAGDHGAAARAFESVLASSALPDAERRQFVAAAAAQYYAAKEYAKAAELAGRYLRDGGADRSVRTIYVQALYLGHNFSAAAKALAADIEADEQAGRAPAEDTLLMLANSCRQIRDAAGYARALEKLVAHHPKKEYWRTAIQSVVTLPGYSDRLAIDVARLKLATGTMRNANDYVEAVQLSLQDGFPREALSIYEKGVAAGMLGAGPEAARHKRLKALIDKDVAEDRPVDSKSGKTLLNEGYNDVLRGQTKQGLERMEQGLKLAGGLKRPDHARLQLAYAYHLAGQNQKAIQVYRTVQGNDGAAALARLWVSHLPRGS
jgi:hypothetical protein